MQKLVILIPKNLSNQKEVLYLRPLRAISSVGSEHLVYTEGVGGSNPSLPTSIKIPMNENSSGFFNSQRVSACALTLWELENPAMRLSALGF